MVVDAGWLVHPRPKREHSLGGGRNTYNLSVLDYLCAAVYTTTGTTLNRELIRGWVFD